MARSLRRCTRVAIYIGGNSLEAEKDRKLRENYYAIPLMRRIGTVRSYWSINGRRLSRSDKWIELLSRNRSLLHYAIYLFAERKSQLRFITLFVLLVSSWLPIRENHSDAAQQYDADIQYIGVGAGKLQQRFLAQHDATAKRSQHFGRYGFAFCVGNATREDLKI